MGLVHFDSKHRATDDSTPPNERTDDEESANSRADGVAGVSTAHIRQTDDGISNLEDDRDKGKDSPDNGQDLGSVERSASNGARDHKSDKSGQPYQKGTREEGEEQTNRRKGNGPDVQALKTGRVGAGVIDVAEDEVLEPDLNESKDTELLWSITYQQPPRLG